MQPETSDNFKADDAKRPIDIIVEHLGKRQALALIEQFGGQRIWIPKHGIKGDAHPLMEVEEKTRAFLIERFCGEELCFPLKFQTPAMLRQRIRYCLLAGGMKSNDIAQALNCTDRTVRREIAQMRTEGLLPPLQAKKLPSFQKEQTL